LWCG
jgi:hypothetical protein